MKDTRPALIGLTGGIASGKSNVSLLMGRKSGFFSIDADQVARELFSSPGQALEGLRGVTGGRFFCTGGLLDRSLFRQAVFTDKGLRELVDQYTHPLIWDLICQKIAACQGRGVRQVIVEVPLLFEAEWQDYFQRIIVVYADYDTCISRLVFRDRVVFAEAKRAYDTQLALTEKVFLADHVIDNSRGWCDTILQVNRLCRIISEKNT